MTKYNPGKIQEYDDVTNAQVYNAALTIAIEIGRLIVSCGYYSIYGDYIKWWNTLEVIERRMEKKIREAPEIKMLIDNIKQKYHDDMQEYLYRMGKKKKHISAELNNKIKTFLCEYERELIYARDKLGYGIQERINTDYHKPTTMWDKELN